MHVCTQTLVTIRRKFDVCLLDSPAPQDVEAVNQRAAVMDKMVSGALSDLEITSRMVQAHVSHKPSVRERTVSLLRRLVM